VRNRHFAFTLLLLSSAAVAQSPPPPPPAPPAPPRAGAPAKPAAPAARASIIVRPSLEPVQQAFLAARMPSVRPVLVISYDANGVPTNLELDPPSGNTEVDVAILEWGRQVRLSPGRAGQGRVPINLIADSDDSAVSTERVPEIASDRIALRPPLQPAIEALDAAGGGIATYDLMLFYAGNGDVIDASIAAGARGDGVDRAVLAWARQLKLKPGSAGAGRLRVDVRGTRR
jgi:outer membrane biosynthesis protein TonB